MVSDFVQGVGCEDEFDGFDLLSRKSGSSQEDVVVFIVNRDSS